METANEDILGVASSAERGLASSDLTLTCPSLTRHGGEGGGGNACCGNRLPARGCEFEPCLWSRD